MAPVANNNVFIGNDTIKFNAGTDDAILHDNGIFDDATLPDFYTAEENTVLNRTFDDATVRDERIFDDGVLGLLAGRRVTHCGIDIARTEQLVSRIFA